MATVIAILTENSLATIEDCEKDIPIIINGGSYAVNKRFADLRSDLPLLQDVDKLNLKRDTKVSHGVIANMPQIMDSI